MTRRKRIVETMFKLATVQERQAQAAFGQTQTEHESAEAEAEALDQVAERGEAELTAQGTLGSIERELLWAHRTWVRQERVATEERLAMTAEQMRSAEERLNARKRDTRVREKVRDHIASSEHHEREVKAQKEQDDLTNTRWTRERW